MILWHLIIFKSIQIMWQQFEESPFLFPWRKNGVGCGYEILFILIIKKRHGTDKIIKSSVSIMHYSLTIPQTASSKMNIKSNQHLSNINTAASQRTQPDWDWTVFKTDWSQFDDREKMILLNIIFFCFWSVWIMCVLRQLSLIQH